MPHRDAAPIDLPGANAAALGERLCRTILTAPSERLAAEESLRSLSVHARDPEAKQHAAAMAACEEACAAATAAAKAKRESGQVDARQTCERRLARVDASEKSARQATDRERLEILERIKGKVDERVWTADTVYETREPLPGAQFAALKKATEELVAEVDREVEEATDLLARARIRIDFVETGSLARDSAESPTDFAGSLERERTLVAGATARLRSATLVRVLRVPLMHLTAFGVLVAIAGGTSWIFVRGDTANLLVTLACAAVVVAGGLAVAWSWAGRTLKRIAEPIAAARALVDLTARQSLAAGTARRASLEEEYRTQHKREREAALGSVEGSTREMELAYQRKRATITENAAAERAKAGSQQQESLAAALALAEEETAKAAAQRKDAIAREERRHAARMQEIALVEATHLKALRMSWHAAQTSIIEDSTGLVEIDQALFPRWADPSWKSFRGRAHLAGAAKVGAITVNLRDIPGALPHEPELAWAHGAHRTLHVPVVLGLPRDASLLIEAPREGRSAGIALLQEAMLRILTSVPPGMARFTIADPVGLGEGFAAFMHLSDDAEHLIGERIWTDPRHIEQRLSDLCQHMETVIQKFLRNEFASLDEYNRTAGEIAEPYRFLVLCDFPANISESASKHLASIVNSGRRCGVFTLILRDLAAPTPMPLTNNEMRAAALTLVWQDGHYKTASEWLGKFPIASSPPPTKEETIALLKRIGTAARDSKRVEVPFASIAPKDGAIWTESAASTLTVPLGRSGATRLQAIQLGSGTSQHALIAGKTGSGKSTLFHALITNLALRFSPDEAELWLIDFKKGVEFRTYATNALPHARVVAVESDREFGLSVLRGLDAELRRRGELFRKVGVQDLAGYRRSGSEEVVPRSLLIIDEFQELFTEDDKVSEESALLLDRLVRQGRAFGMHVVLGSQTLGGAYSIARATMGQMAVRIALQCNEADSQLILSDDNLAGRLLSRPGDAIYNDSGGLVEGNNPFQVVWLSDEERDRCLARVREQQVRHPPKRRTSMIVFEGNVPAHLEDNAPLVRALGRRAEWAVKGPLLLWLGDAISIKDPTAMPLARQTGANLMVIGQRDEAALALSASALVSFAAQVPSDRGRVLLLDGTPPDSPDHGRLAQLAHRLGVDAMIGGARDAERVLEAARAELAKRQEDHATLAPPWLILVHALHRFRALRRNEDDYSFSSSSGDAPPTPDKALATILKEGPSLGIHVMVTCDGATNLARSFDRNAIREFEHRALFQISATDSSTLIDSPVASRLGPMRALLHSEETGTQEKFRPYTWPDEAWVARTFHLPPRSP